MHKIGRKNLPINSSTRVCSRHCIGSKGRKLCPDEYPTLNLPILPTQVTQPQRRKSPKKRVDSFSANDDRHQCSSALNDNEKCSKVNDSVSTTDASTLTTLVGEDTEALVKECELLRRDLADCEAKLKAAEFRISSVMYAYDDKKIQFYTGFPSYKLFKAWYDFLRPAVDNLTYWDSGKSTESVAGVEKRSKGRHRALLPIDEFF